jgi:GNAT superfamily N-acetyltransferase
MVTILPVRTEEQILAVRGLFLEYAASLGFDLCFQGFERELAELPGSYAPPEGCLLLAVDAEGNAGCVALRPLGNGACEMKRLFVRPGHQGQGIGRQLALAIIDEARKIGYTRMKLDTISTMTETIGLYRSIGFVETQPYTHNSIPGAVFFELELGE